MLFRSKGFNRFQFDNYSPISQKVNPVATVQFEVLVYQRERFLSLKWYAAQAQFSCQALRISRFQ